VSAKCLAGVDALLNRGVKRHPVAFGALDGALFDGALYVGNGFFNRQVFGGRAKFVLAEARLQCASVADCGCRFHWASLLQWPQGHCFSSMFFS
jgi:hypothetical protein